MRILDLPPSVLLAIFTYTAVGQATPAYGSPTPVSNGTQNATLATTGSGASYASACYSAQASYSSAYDSYNSAHAWVSTTLLTQGPTSLESVTYYENASTLCDGHARVTYSPAISVSAGNITHTGLQISTSTILGTYFSNYPSASPTCSISPSDCDPLWAAYSSSVSAAGPLITASPIMTPPCLNMSQASAYADATSEIYGCGRCTIYGEGVQLVYFPTTASIDYCASTPAASLTHYGPGAVITAYAGKSTQDGTVNNGTVFADGHAFTSGTAYISISTVYAVDRCSKTFGVPVNDAILAMPSESVLSLRYSQDHFQRLMQTDKITGYPVSYADFNTPIPWSAWNGQNLCDPGGYGGWACSIIYEQSFRPQLAIPPAITQLSPDFEGCQMWYNGLWDPPLALQEQTAADRPTGYGGGYGAPSTAAVPSATPASPTGPVTALSAEKPASTTRQNQIPGPTRPATQPSPNTPDAEPWMQSFEANGHTFWASGANGQVHVDGATLTSGGSTKTLQGGVYASYGAQGLILSGSSTVAFHQPTSSYTAEADSQSTGGTGGSGGSGSTGGTGGTGAAITSGLSGPTGQESEPADAEATTTITINGQTHSVVQSSDGGPIVIDQSTTITPGGAATTLADGEVLSAASSGVVFAWSSTLGKSAGGDTSSTTGTGSLATTSGGGQTASGNGQTASMTAASSTSQQTGVATRMTSSQALSFSVALIALTFALGT